MPILVELVPVHPPARAARFHRVRRIAVDEPVRSAPAIPQVRYPIADDEGVPRDTARATPIDAGDTGSPSELGPEPLDRASIHVDADGRPRRPLPDHDGATAQERLDVHIVRRLLTDDLLVDARPSLTTRVTHSRHQVFRNSAGNGPRLPPMYPRRYAAPNAGDIIRKSRLGRPAQRSLSP